MKTETENVETLDRIMKNLIKSLVAVGMSSEEAIKLVVKGE